MMSTMPSTLAAKLKELSQNVEQLKIPVRAEQIAQLAYELHSISLAAQHHVSTAGSGPASNTDELMATIARLSPTLAREHELRIVLLDSGDGLVAKLAIESLKLSVISLQSAVDQLRVGAAL